MARLPYLTPANAPGKSKEYLEALEKKLGKIPNIFKAMANSPAALNSYISLSTALGEASLNAKMRESIALAVGEENSCEYCVSAHSAIGAKAGLSPSDIDAARKFDASGTKEKGLLKFVKAVLDTKGFVSDQDMDAARKAGLTDGELAEAVAAIALNIYTNYFNHVADTEVDFPKVELFKKAA